MRRFALVNGKPRIKDQVFIDKNGVSSVTVSPKSKQTQIFEADKQVFTRSNTCSFVRKYIPGEFDIHPDVDLSGITHTYVILHVFSDEHILHHLAPLAETYRAITFDMEDGTALLARVPLLPEQAEVIRQAFGRKE